MKKTLAVFAAATMLLSLAAAPAAVPAPVCLVHDQYVESKNILDRNVYQVSTTVGHDVEIKLGENPSRNEIWQVVSYDPAQCRVKIEHEKKGFWPFNREYAEIELKGLVRGQQTLVFQCGSKSITVRLSTL